MFKLVVSLFMLFVACETNAQKLTWDFSKAPNSFSKDTTRLVIENPSDPILNIVGVKKKDLEAVLSKSFIGQVSKPESRTTLLAVADRNAAKDSVGTDHKRLIRAEAKPEDTVSIRISLRTAIPEDELDEDLVAVFELSMSNGLAAEAEKKEVKLIQVPKQAEEKVGSVSQPTSPPNKLPVISPHAAVKFITDTYGDNLLKTDVGFKLKNEDYYTIHIFLDQFCNPLYGSLPTGIQRKYHYKIHIIYPETEKLNFSIRQTAGTLSDNPVFYNSGVAVPKEQAGSIEKAEDPTTIADLVFNLFPTTDDLVFDIYLTSPDNKSTKTEKIQSYTIKKTPYYTGSFNIGGIYTWLKNPTYSLVTAPGGGEDKTVKVVDNSPSVLVSFTYTLYWSPVNALFPRRSRNKDFKKFNSWGRSYLDDGGSVLRKIYPCLGFGLNDKVFTNVLAGFNCEPMQGFGIFAGANIRKVNTFNMPNHVLGETIVTQDQFNYYQNTDWKTGWALGLVIDLNVFSKVVSSVTTATK